MCGICGFNWTDEALLARMMQVQAHRGPDDAGTYGDEGISLGHRRLAIIDLSEAGRQPMANEDGSLRLVYNGEIYNYVELRADLRARGHRFASRTDTEVVLHAYETWGEACLERFNGQFAFALYDRPRRRLLLARDRFGIKPLHYWSSGGRFAFASEIKALLQHPAVRRRPDGRVVYDYLVFNRANLDAATFFRDVRTVLPGQCLAVDLRTGRVRARTWYEIPAEAGRPPRSERRAVDAFLERFLDAVRLRLTRSDVEVGSCLSGGLDSSAIVCSLGRLGEARPRAHRTFSAVFEDSHLDESAYVDAVVARTGVRSHRTRPSGQGLVGALRRLVYYQEEPFSSASVFSQWEVMRLAHAHRTKVLLDGQGGDELLAGYLFLAGYLLLDALSRCRPGEAAAEAVGALRAHGWRPDAFLAAAWFALPPAWRVGGILRRQGTPLAPAFARRWRDESRTLDRLYRPMDLAQALVQRTRFALPQLLRAEDRNAMAHSIESRLPFLDHRLVAYVFSLGPSWKVRRGETKYLLRRAMRGILPEAVLRRRDKLGFSTPFARWLREDAVRRFVGGLLESESLRSRGCFDVAALGRLYRRHLAGEDASQTLWKAVNLELWYRQFVDTAPGLEPPPFEPAA